MPRTASATRARAVEVGAPEHAVAVDARVHESPHPAGAEPLDHRLDRDVGLLGPSGAGKLPGAGVDRDHHAVAELGHRLVEEVDVGVRRGPDHDPGRAGADRTPDGFDRP